MGDPLQSPAHEGCAPSKPLRGFRVLDLSTLFFGPYASQLLADYGADVIKIEAPGGDVTRWVGPSLEPGMSGSYLGSNRNKKSIVLDLTEPQGRAALVRLVATADVLMHNIRPQKLAKLGLDPATVRAAHPRLVYAVFNGFAEAGPYAGRPAFDDIIQGLSGLPALARLQTGHPQYMPTVGADKVGALFGAQAIMAALLGRERSGVGCLVEVPMFESMVAYNLVEHLYGHSFEPTRGDMGYPRALSPWRKPFRTSDGFVCMMPYTDSNWRSFFETIGRPDLCDDARFATIVARTTHIHALYEIVDTAVAQQSTDYWLENCDRLDIPAGKMNEPHELEHDPHLLEVGFFQMHDSGVPGTQVRMPSNPVRFDGQSPSLVLAPRLGQDTVRVLQEAGFSLHEIEALTRGGAARPPQAPAPTETPS
ncbi:MAG: CoA transferase [Pseudomonadota bacterium]